MKKIENILDALPQISGKRLYIWGAGNTAMLFREGLMRIPELVIEAFIDNDPLKQNKKIGNIPIISADKMINDDKTFVMICTGQPKVFSTIAEHLNRLGVINACIDAAIFGLYKSDILKVYESLEDSESKRIYLEMLENRINCRFPNNELITKNPYFCFPNFSDSAVGEVFIDCGAYVGDSLERYIWAHEGVFEKIIAFEPDSSNFRALEFRIERLTREWNISKERIQCFPWGISDEDSIQYIENYKNNNGLGSKISTTPNADSEECRTVSLEHFIKTSNCFLKADIESYEYRMLKGAEKSIELFKPKMAICIYHNSVDFFSIPLLIKRIVPEYKLSVRHHSSTLSETVLYAYI